MSLLVGKWVQDLTLNETKIKLTNDAFLQGRNALDTADLDLFKVNASDLFEFGIEPIYGSAPTLGSSLVNRDYVDGVVFGMRDPKDACRVASGVNIDISSPPAAIDGVTLSANDRVLLKDQTLGEENGIYVYSAAGVPLVRSEDADSDAEVTQGMSCLVIEGAVHARNNYALTTVDPITLGVTPLTFAQVPSLGVSYNFRNLGITLNSTDISNGYIDLAQPAVEGSIVISPKGGPVQESGVDFTLGGSPTRITFAGDLATYLADTDILLVSYAFEV